MATHTIINLADNYDLVAQYLLARQINFLIFRRM